MKSFSFVENTITASWIDNKLFREFTTTKLNENIYSYLYNNLSLKSILNSTSEASVNQVNKDFLDKLEKEEPNFIIDLIHSEFEDGCINEVTKFVNEKVQQNPFMTALWLSSLFGLCLTKYKDHKDIITIEYGLLEIISQLDSTKNIESLKKSLIPIIKIALDSNTLFLEEAGLKVIKSWRDPTLLSLLDNCHFSNPFIQKYAEHIQSSVGGKVE